MALAATNRNRHSGRGAHTTHRGLALRQALGGVSSVSAGACRGRSRRRPSFLLPLLAALGRQRGWCWTRRCARALRWMAWLPSLGAWRRRRATRSRCRTQTAEKDISSGRAVCPLYGTGQIPVIHAETLRVGLAGTEMPGDANDSAAGLGAVSRASGSPTEIAGDIFHDSLALRPQGCRVSVSPSESGPDSGAAQPVSMEACHFPRCCTARVNGGLPLAFTATHYNTTITARRCLCLETSSRRMGLRWFCESPQRTLR